MASSSDIILGAQHWTPKLGQWGCNSSESKRQLQKIKLISDRKSTWPFASKATCTTRCSIYRIKYTHDKHNAHHKPAVPRGVVNQKPPIFVFKKYDQSDCSVSMGKWCHRDGRDTTWPITKYFCKHTVLNITTYKKIRVEGILINFAFPYGNWSVFMYKYTLEYSDILQPMFNLIFGSVSGHIRIRRKIL